MEITVDEPTSTSSYLRAFDGEQLALLEDVNPRDFLRLALGWG